MENASPSAQAVIDAEHLKLLSIFHYIASALSALFACIPFIHLAIGIGIVAFGGNMSSHDKPPAFLGWFFIALASVLIVVGWTHAILIFLAGRFLAARKHHTYCLVVGCVECLFLPLGTILGVFTIIVLSRPTVKALFPQNQPDPPQI